MVQTRSGLRGRIGGGSGGVVTVSNGTMPNARYLRGALARLQRARTWAWVAAWTVVLGFTIGSAILAKEMRYAPPLAAVTPISVAPNDGTVVLPLHPETIVTPSAEVAALFENRVSTLDDLEHFGPALNPDAAFAFDPTIRWFQGRPIRPARSVSMLVTAYSPDARSCGKYADGRTATMHHISTNAGHFVAADPTILPYGSMISVPGYDEGEVVPVLDCGGAIKGYRLDVLYPTHESALKWGSQRLNVVVWEFADGLGPSNPRQTRSGQVAN